MCVSGCGSESERERGEGGERERERERERARARASMGGQPMSVGEHVHVCMIACVLMVTSDVPLLFNAICYLSM